MKYKIIQRSLNFAIAGVIFAPACYKTKSAVELSKICNGCGASNAKFDFVPDRIYGTSIGEACHVHDYMYAIGYTIEDKEEADRVFLNNMFRLIERDKRKWYKPTWLQRKRALTYYNAVKHFGGDAFWKGKNAT